jgi:hypothetical protein
MTLKDKVAVVTGGNSGIAFLAGETATYMTATTVLADGGLMQSSPGL